MTASNETGRAEIEKVGGTISLNGRDHVITLIEKYAPKGVAAEVGTFNGTFADQILANTSLSKLYCVDPYATYNKFKDAINELDLDATFNRAKRFLSRFGERVSFIRKFSVPASTDFDDGSLDVVYIDGNHQSKYVMQDLTAWWPKVKPGGLIIGDDCVDLDDTRRNEAGDITIVHRRREDGSAELYGDYGVYHASKSFCAANNLGFVVLRGQLVLPKW